MQTRIQLSSNRLSGACRAQFTISMIILSGNLLEVCLVLNTSCSDHYYIAINSTLE